jgi:L-lactate dehydrogenase complex protein LldG
VPAALRPAVPALAPETAPLGISMAAGAAAETGTLLLDSREGRRLQLLPPVHLIWILESDIERTLGAALARFRADSAEAGLPAAIGLHSAPSKSADIGRILVVGVHGPGRVIAAIIPRGANP